jgi:hypothetical protein
MKDKRPALKDEVQIVSSCGQSTSVDSGDGWIWSPSSAAGFGDDLVKWEEEGKNAIGGPVFVYLPDIIR